MKERKENGDEKSRKRDTERGRKGRGREREREREREEDQNLIILKARCFLITEKNPKENYEAWVQYHRAVRSS